MGQLRLSTDELVDAGTDLHRVARELDTAEVTADRLADAVGHPGLAAKVKDFAYGWVTRRTEMLDDVARLADACHAIGDTFQDLDAELATAARGEE